MFAMAMLLLQSTLWLGTACAGEPGNALVLHVDNDEFTGLNKRDRWYTSGIRIAYVQNDQPGERKSTAAQLMGRITSLCPALGAAPHQPATTHWSIGHNIYTQENRLRTAPDSNDRPIAAYLYGTVGKRTQTRSGSVGMSMEVGITGPAALGEPVQNGLHDLLGVSRVPAWSYQLRPRAGVNLHLQCMGRSRLGWSDLLTEYTASLGSTIARGGLGVAMAFGPGRHSSAMPHDARFSIPGNRPVSHWAALVGLQANWVGHDTLLDGAAFRYQSGVRSKALTAQLFASLSLTIFKDWRLEYIYTLRGDDFEVVANSNSKRGRQQIGTLKLHIPVR